MPRPKFFLGVSKSSYVFFFISILGLQSFFRSNVLAQRLLLDRFQKNICGFFLFSGRSIRSKSHPFNFILLKSIFSNISFGHCWFLLFLGRSTCFVLFSSRSMRSKPRPFRFMLLDKLVFFTPVCFCFSHADLRRRSREMTVIDERETMKFGINEVIRNPPDHHRQGYHQRFDLCRSQIRIEYQIPETVAEDWLEHLGCGCPSSFDLGRHL